MRKRSEIPAATQPAPMKQQEIPGTHSPSPPQTPFVEKPSATVPHVSVDNGIVFIKCPDCGLSQSSQTAVRLAVRTAKSGEQLVSLLHCFRCKGLLDPDEVLTPEYLDRLKHSNATGTATVQAPVTSATTNPNGAPSNPPAPRQPDPSPAAPPPPTVQKPASEAPKPANWGPPKFCHHPKGEGVCGRELVQTNAGYFAPCGHPQTGPVLKQDVLKQAGDVHHHAAVGETVRVVWGEEVYRTGEFSNFRVGPFERTTTVRPGETVEQAIARLNNDLAGFAKSEFQRKATEHLDNIDRLAGMFSERDNQRKAARA